MNNTQYPIPAAAMVFGSRVRPSPYFAATLRWGASAFTTYNHTFMPSIYKSATEDYHYLTNTVTLWDVAGERQVEIRGADAAKFAQYLTPRNLATCVAGRCRYVLITNEQGGIINDPVLLRLADDCIWLSAADADLLLWCRGVALNAGFDVQINTPDVSPLQLQGPMSTDVAVALFGDWVKELAYFHLRQFDFEGVPLVLSRTGWSGERGYEIYLRDGEKGDWLWERIMAAGAPFDIQPAAPSTIRRIEAGMVSYGADANDKDTPFHIGLERLVDNDGGYDFIGKAALQRTAANGVQRRLVGVVIDGEPMAAPLVRWWNALADDGRRIGKIRSAVYSPALKQNIGLAMLDKPFDEIGAQIGVHSEYDERHSATVCAIPFTPHKTV